MIRAKKKFGQNFLKDSVVLDKIIQAIPKEIFSDKYCDLVEIGAGLGDLTKKLLEISKVKSYEIDEDLFIVLNQTFKKEIDEKKLILTLGDALKIWDKISQKNYFLVANLPYYVATNIMLKAVDDPNCLGFIVMIQREVALKFCGFGGSNSLSLITSLNGEIKTLFDVPPSSFEPEPKVMSSVVKFSKFDNFNELDRVNYESYKDFLKTCFLSPRKTILKNLSSKIDKEILKKCFEELNLDQNLRAHQLNNTLIVKIFNYLKVKNGKKSK